MARALEELIREAAALPEADRAMLAGVLLESLEPEPTPAVKAAWTREIARRADEVREGRATLIDWEDVRAELFRDE